FHWRRGPTPSATAHHIADREIADRRLLGSGLPSLLLQHFTRVTDALLLVGIRLAQPTDVRSNLSDELSIDAGHGDVRLLLDGDVDSRRDVEHHRVRVAKREDDLLALHLGAIADADDVEFLLEPFGDPRDRVGDQCARKAVILAELGIVAR